MMGSAMSWVLTASKKPAGAVWGTSSSGGEALGANAVGQPDRQEHHRERADQRDQERRGAGEDRGHDELGYEQQAEHDADERERTAPAREHDCEQAERDCEPEQGAVPVVVDE